MTDHEPASAEVASQSPQSAPVDANASADVGTESPPSQASVKEPASPKPENVDASPKENGKESKPSTPRGKKGKNSKDKEKEKTKENEKDSPGEGKPKKPAPYVNEDRFKTGGIPREKLSPEELAARMERIRLNNEKIKERRAAVQADEQAFQESQAALRAKTAQQRKIQAGIEEKRAANARRKMERAGGREWDNFKKGANAGGGTNASMHAPKPPNTDTDGNPEPNANEDGNEGKEDWPAEQASPWTGEGERGRGRGRGAGRARSRGRGARGGGGGGRGGPGDSRRDRPPHKDASQDKPQDTDTTDWGAAGEEWGKAVDTDVDQQTGIAITTNEADPWGTAAADDPWGTATANDPWGAPATTGGA